MNSLSTQEPECSFFVEIYTFLPSPSQFPPFIVSSVSAKLTLLCLTSFPPFSSIFLASFLFEPGLRLPGQSYQLTGATNIITPSHFSKLPLLLIVPLLLLCSLLHILFLRFLPDQTVNRWPSAWGRPACGSRVFSCKGWRLSPPCTHPITYSKLTLSARIAKVCWGRRFWVDW